MARRWFLVKGVGVLRQMHKEMLQLKITHSAVRYGKIWETSTSLPKIREGGWESEASFRVLRALQTDEWIQRQGK